ncbi:MAG: thiamine-phosphate kinase [Terriglobales bacterium]
MPDSEKTLIRRIRRLAAAGPAVVTGIGDDAAVLRIPAGHEMLVTTDFTLENIHFRREWHPPEVVGWRCLTRGLSDIAAMGGEPHAAFLSLALGSDLPQNWIDKFLSGLLALAKKHAVPLAGGDTAQSPGGIQADIVVVGSVPKGKAVLRSGAKPGHNIYVTGSLGGSAAALARLRKGLPLGAEKRPHFHPEPRVKVGQWLRRKRIPSAMIDISDGLSTDLEHLCTESHVGAEIELAAIPRARAGRGKTLVDLDCALHGGDDYELLFTSSRPVPSRVEGVPVTRIGRTTTSRGMRLIAAEGRKSRLQVRGWEHFRGDS